MFLSGGLTIRIYLVTGASTTTTSLFYTHPAPLSIAIVATGTPSGHFVDYLVTYVAGGQESAGTVKPGATTYQLPVDLGEDNKAVITVPFNEFVALGFLK